MPASALIACPECDLLQQLPALAHAGSARCGRCGFTLYRAGPDLDVTLAMTLAAGLLFLLANVFAIVQMDVQGNSSATTLFGAVRTLEEQGRPLVAALVFVTTVLVPALQLAALSYLLLPLRFGRRPRHGGRMVRLLHAIQPWAMIEVFVLGVLVSVVRLAFLAEIIPGVGLWAFAGLLLLLPMATASFDARAWWARLATLDR